MRRFWSGAAVAPLREHLSGQVPNLSLNVAENSHDVLLQCTDAYFRSVTMWTVQ